MSINSDGFYVDGKQYYFIPPMPTEETRGGIKAKARTTENIEVVVDTDGRAYVAGSGGSNLVADVDYLTPGTAATTYQPVGNYLTEEEFKGTVTSVNGNVPDVNGAINFEIPSGLPEVTAADNDKVLAVVDGIWAPAENSGSLSLEDIATPEQVLDYLASTIPDFTQEAF